ncbi:MAG TPA: hypothetical protein PL169_06350 [Leptospiraceae bacterium]|nr:hypothetical protein [Leptospiraceae bacterium]
MAEGLLKLLSGPHVCTASLLEFEQLHPSLRHIKKKGGVNDGKIFNFLKRLRLPKRKDQEFQEDRFFTPAHLQIKLRIIPAQAGAK